MIQSTKNMLSSDFLLFTTLILWTFGRRSSSIIAAFICKDMWPIHVVSGEGFHDLMTELKPQCKIPSCNMISRHKVQLYDTTLENIATILEGNTLWPRMGGHKCLCHSSLYVRIQTNTYFWVCVTELNCIGNVLCSRCVLWFNCIVTFRTNRVEDNIK